MGKTTKEEPAHSRAVFGMEPLTEESKEMNTVLGWILDFAVRHECVELVQVLPKTGHQPGTIGALALRQLKTSFEELASNPSPCFEEWQGSSFEEAMKTHSGCAPESAPKWLLELKERVVICLMLKTNFGQHAKRWMPS